jgi:hypothetical protein
MKRSILQTGGVNVLPKSFVGLPPGFKQGNTRGKSY